MEFTAASTRPPHLDRVVTRRELTAAGVGRHRIDAQLAARRWRQAGRVIVPHNGPLTRSEQWEVALAACGPRAVLTSFTAAEAVGLRGWFREAVHVMAPGGTVRPAELDFPLVLHRTRDWDALAVHPQRRLQRLAPALIVAASSFARPRPACGLLAAATQQRLVRVGDLDAALRTAPRTRHRRALHAAIGDLAQGSQALSEIDFVQLCRRYKLPVPERQTVRRQASGRRRYLDASWNSESGKTIGVEVDGAIHCAAQSWWADQLRQNELTLGGTTMLRYPSVIVRHEPALVAEQLRRALAL